MNQSQIVKLDQEGRTNARILAKEAQADFRRVEAASVKRTTRLASPEGKRVFARFFGSLQLNVHFVSTIARMKLEPEVIDRVEDALRERIEQVTRDINQAIDGAEALFQGNGITEAASYDTAALEIRVGVISALGLRYFDLIHKLDQLMPLIQTLEIHEVIKARAADIERRKFKRAVRGIAGGARTFAAGLRKRMYQIPVKESGEAQREAGQGRSEEVGASEAVTDRESVPVSAPLNHPADAAAPPVVTADSGSLAAVAASRI